MPRWRRAGGTRPSGSQHHEAFLDEGASLPSDRSFVFILAGVLAVVGVAPLVRGGSARGWALLLMAILVLVGSLRPGWAHPANRAWMLLGVLLGRAVTTLLLTVLFFLVVTPLAWLRRRRGEDPLRLRREPHASTYWIDRQPPGPAPDTLTRQF